MNPTSPAERLRGCLLAGACGDALGAPLEFLSRAQIRERFADDGPAEFVPGPWPVGSVTDDTQMALFTAEGLIRARTRLRLEGTCNASGVMRHAYLRWLHAIPAARLARLEGRKVIERVAEDLAAHFIEGRPSIEEQDSDRYPGW